MNGLKLAATAGVLLSATLIGGPAQAAPVEGDCSNDTKGFGPTLLSTEDAPGTWWRLTREGLEAAGIMDEAGWKAAMETVFGESFATLEDAVEALVAAVVDLDKNGNGYVCPSAVRGTIANVPLDEGWQNYFFAVHDDKHVKG